MNILVQNSHSEISMFKKKRDSFNLLRPLNFLKIMQVSCSIPEATYTLIYSLHIYEDTVVAQTAHKCHEQ